MAEQIREKRATESRKSFERPASWMAPSLLPDPNPEEGYVFRWIRVASLGKDDPTNISGKLREGWEPVKASDHPEIRLFGETEGQFPDSVVVGGLMLCKTPGSLVDTEIASLVKTEGFPDSNTSFDALIQSKK